MSLEQELVRARHEIITDGYDMSIGELMSLYQNKELIINPVFQRYFRWDISRKTRFVESILLGIPVPPIFVYQTDEGVWELVDGLQRLSTLFEFAGILVGDDGQLVPPLELDGTKQLPSLAGKRWQAWDENDNEECCLTNSQRLEIKRSRMRVEILKKGSSPLAKYELFQRLNTGGAALSEQEVRNCVMVMIDPKFHEWLRHLAAYEPFQRSVGLTQSAKDRQLDVELALRFVVFRNQPYVSGLDVHEYLDDATVRLASDPNFDLAREADIFRRVFDLLEESTSDNAFRRYDGQRFVGQFLMSAFEVVAIGVAANLDQIMNRDNPAEFVKGRIRQMWQEDHFRKYSGAGVRGTTRLSNLLPWGREFFKYEA